MSENHIPLVSVFQAGRCVGFVLSRGIEGFEAVDETGVSYGLFRTKGDAASLLLAPMSEPCCDCAE